MAADPDLAPVIAKDKAQAPTGFAEHKRKLNARKDLVIEGESFRWVVGE